jgi:hypothetical protein
MKFRQIGLHKRAATLVHALGHPMALDTGSRVRLKVSRVGFAAMTTWLRERTSMHAHLGFVSRQHLKPRRPGNRWWLPREE